MVSPGRQAALLPNLAPQQDEDSHSWRAAAEAERDGVGGHRSTRWVYARLAAPASGAGWMRGDRPPLSQTLNSAEQPPVMPESICAAPSLGCSPRSRTALRRRDGGGGRATPSDLPARAARRTRGGLVVTAIVTTARPPDKRTPRSARKAKRGIYMGSGPG